MRVLISAKLSNLEYLSLWYVTKLPQKRQFFLPSGQKVRLYFLVPFGLRKRVGGLITSNRLILMLKSWAEPEELKSEILQGCLFPSGGWRLLCMLGSPSDQECTKPPPTLTDTYFAKKLNK